MKCTPCLITSVVTVLMVIVTIIQYTTDNDLSKVFGSSVALTIGEGQWYRLLTSILVNVNVNWRYQLIMMQGLNILESTVGSSIVFILMIMVTVMTNCTQLLLCMIGSLLTNDNENLTHRISIGSSHVILAMIVIIAYHLPKHLQPNIMMQTNTNYVTSFVMLQERGYLVGYACARLMSWMSLVFMVKRKEGSNALVVERMVRFGFIPIANSRMMEPLQQHHGDELQILM